MDQLQPHQTIGQAVAAGAEIVDLVVQDEFTHDVVTRSNDGGWLVYDTT